MNLIKSPHSFHIPVMGTGYTIDTPIKTAHFGISSVVSLADHRLISQMHRHYADKYNLPYKPIPKNDPDYRANTITGYLNLLHQIIQQNHQRLKESPFEKGSEICKYFEMLPENSTLKKEYLEMLGTEGNQKLLMQQELRNKITSGSIDVNVMTKLDKTNYQKKEALPSEYNDAHAAVRGFANSDLNGAIVLSAGLNPRLFSYMAGFRDFLPDAAGNFKKRIILKVSDYRSALIQGKFLAKKGLWVSEFRIESGLNCGGHAFATDGFLLGPILEEFKEKRTALQEELFNTYKISLADQNLNIPNLPAMSITVQGGVGTAEEHNFLIKHYSVDAVGWGTPFLLVPEAVSIDEATMNLLIQAREKDLYLSEISPLGVPFNSVKDNTAELQRLKRIEANKPGSPCIKEHLVSSSEFSEQPLCTASRNYQKQKINQLQMAGLDEDDLAQEVEAVTQKTCLCMGLGNAALTATGIPRHKVLNAIAVCPGPNMAYFDKVVSLRKMIDHIYGRTNIITRTDRPHMFLKELRLYVDYFKNKIKALVNLSERDQKYLQSFRDNLLAGIEYYKKFFSSFIKNEIVLVELDSVEAELRGAL